MTKRGAGLGGGAALAGQPLLAKLAALLLGGAAPDAGLLVRLQGELEARGLGLAAAADGLGVLDLAKRHPGGADGEEEIRVDAAAARSITPVVGVPVVRPG